MDPSPPGTGRVGRRFVVSGRVQGVGFRFFVLRHAQALGLGGWTRNLPGGEVEVRAWGGEDELTKLGQLLARGPRSAIVTNVDIFEISDPESGGRHFSIVS